MFDETKPGNTESVEVVKKLTCPPIFTEEARINALVKLDRNGGNLKKTSRELGIPRTTLHNWSRNGIAITAEMQRKRVEQREGIISGLWDITGQGIPMVLAKLPSLPPDKVMDIVMAAARILEMFAKSEREAAMVDIERIKADFARVIGNHVTDPNVLMAIAYDLDKISLPGGFSNPDEDGDTSGGFDPDTDDPNSDGETGETLRPDDPNEEPDVDTVYTQSGAVVLPGIDGPYGKPEGAT